VSFLFLMHVRVSHCCLGTSRPQGRQQQWWRQQNCISPAYWVDVLTLFLHTRTQQLPIAATYRVLQQTLPVLDVFIWKNWNGNVNRTAPIIWQYNI
jgi:hypothetical protein